MQPRANGADRNLEHVRNLVIGKIFHEVERTHDSVFLRQLTDGVGHALGTKAIDERPGRILPLPRKPMLCRSRVEVEVWSVIEIHGVRSALPAAMVRPEATRENAKDPRLEVR